MTAPASSYGIGSKEVEAYTGFAYTDLLQNGAVMTSVQWDAFIAEYVEVIAQIVHRYCNVPTFDPAQPEATITELRNGRGPTDDSVWPVQYVAADSQFYLHQIYYAADTAIVVQEDTASKTAASAWTTRTVRSSEAGGDYEVITKRELTMVSFHHNIPNFGGNNVKFVYTTGYAPTSKEYHDITFQVLRVFKNLILSKKGVEAIATIFAAGVRDYSQLPNQYSEAQILSHMEQSILKRYRRYPVFGGPFTD